MYGGSVTSAGAVEPLEGTLPGKDKLCRYRIVLCVIPWFHMT
jgi:hypothetical protein